MRVVIDMNLTPRWAECLSGGGHDAAHWRSLGAFSAKDQEICDYVRERADVLLTNDLDFPRILAHTKGGKPSIVLLRGEPLVPEVRGAAVLQALADCERELMQGAILTLDWSDRPRARLLPLR